jgi:hypothetical protein
MNWEKISFKGHSASILETCYIAESDEFKTLKAIQLFDRTDRGDRTVWTPTEKQHLFTDRVYSSEFCGGRGDNCTWQNEVQEYPLQAVVPVRAQARGDHSFGKVLFKKNFEVPICD